ncbi:hypothetical protein SAMN04487764_2162 [Gillisia sp. Hel1_33_143]|uniref:hypothetical protein n=1 Tax=unclassified Gillisia TaxID=2615025 RepID=UPI0005548A1A|nr:MULTISPECIES: hypothetical protein [unclassified Gillisia]SDS41384.1 hypothetical protein SAMN04487764_2162 [Gillisia sp. Hel1_33_143]
MKNLFIFISILSMNFFYAQVGISTSNPQAQLDIVAGSPENPSTIDGILIPRIEKFPLTNPSAAQHGMMVFLKTATTLATSGFYFWNNTSSKWEPISGISGSNFYKPGSTVSPNNINDAIFRKGNMGIGTEDITAKLQVALNSTLDTSIKKALEVDNNNPATDNLTTYGIISDNRSATNGNKYGIKNNVGGIGNGIHYGIFNESYQNSGTNDIYGIFNRVGRTFGANSNNYGLYSEVGSIQGQGNIYGIYSVAYGNSSAKVFAGYFAGRVGIGNSVLDEYILPATRGSSDQILKLDTSGNLNWNYPNTQNYSTTGGATGDFIITDEIYTLRINNTISTITLPQANLNKGRILILIGWDGTATKNFNFLNNDDLYDVVKNQKITSIAGNQIFRIQSAGNRWLFLGN